MQASATYQVIKLADLKESPLNPRKAFDEAALKELSESLKSKGCIEPIVVRGLNGAGKFEVVAGARRFRAAKLAGLAELPAIVRAYSDVEALEVQVVENLQREGVNAIEEADGYQHLIELAGYVRDGKLGKVPDVARIATRIGKSPRYVYDRLTLAGKLIPQAREAGAAGWVTASHLVELARLTKKDQAKALQATLSADFGAYDDDLEETMKAWRTPDEALDDGIENRVMSVRELQQFIMDTVHRPLKDAVFSPANTRLCPKAGSCLDCMKRSDSELGEPSEITQKSWCLDPDCFAEKAEAFDPSSAEPEPARERAPSVDVGPDIKKNHEPLEDDVKAYERIKNASKRADAENIARRKRLENLVARIQGPFGREELVLMFERYAGARSDEIRKLAGGVNVPTASVEQLRKLLLVSMVLQDVGFNVSDWDLHESDAFRPCTSLDALEKIIKIPEKPAAKISGIELMKKVKAGAKKMKVKVVKKKGKERK